MSAITTPAPTFDDVWRALMEMRQQMQESQTKTDLQMQETDKRIDRIAKQIGDVLGDFIEEIVKPATIRLFQDKGLNVHQMAKNTVAYDDDGQFVSEIDLIAINNPTKTAIAIECKSKLSIDDVKEHLERLQKFKQNFSQYEHYQLLGAVAAMVIPDEVGRYAYQRGLFVMAQSGHAMLIKNDGKFTPKMW